LNVLCNVKRLNEAGREIQKEFQSNEALCVGLIGIFQLIANKCRFRIVCTLTRGEFCVNDIAEIVGETKVSNISQHLKMLRLAGLIASRMEGIEANLFFTFFGLHAIVKKKMDKLKVATVGNPALCVPDAMGMAMPTIFGTIPGMSAFATHMMKKEMEKIDIPPVGEFMEMIHDAGANIYSCKATVDMFKLEPEDFCPQMDRVLTVGEFYELSAGSQIIFT
jgi:peroxiredoxin family protein